MFDTLISCLQRGEERSSLDAALSLWQACRDSVVASLVVRLGQRIGTRRRMIGSASIKSRFYEWKTLFHKNDPGDLSTLLDTLVDTPAVTTLRLGYLEHWPQDPRISHVLTGFVGIPPQAWISTGLWDRLFRLVVRNGDSGVLRQLEAVEFEVEDRDVRRILEERTAWAVQTLRPILEDFPTLTDQEREVVQGFLERLPLPLETGSINEEALLAEIVRNQDDPVLKQVYADFLMEQGDPRGEFIALQLAPQDEAIVKRGQELLAQYERIWLGELLEALVPGRTVWEAGFPVRGVLREIPRKDLVRLASSPRWASFRALLGGGVEELLVGGYLEQIREVSGEIMSIVGLLLAKPRGWERIDCHGDTRLITGREGLLDALMKDRAPALRYLVISGAQGSFRNYQAFFDHPAGQRLTHFEVSTPRIVDWVQAWDTLSNLQYLRLCINTGELSLHREANEAGTCRATLPLPALRPGVTDGIEVWLNQLPPNKLTEIAFVLSPESADQEPEWWGKLGWFQGYATRLRALHPGLQKILFLGTEI